MLQSFGPRCWTGHMLCLHDLGRLHAHSRLIAWCSLAAGASAVHKRAVMLRQVPIMTRSLQSNHCLPLIQAVSVDKVSTDHAEC